MHLSIDRSNTRPRDRSIYRYSLFCARAVMLSNPTPQHDVTSTYFHIPTSENEGRRRSFRIRCGCNIYRQLIDSSNIHHPNSFHVCHTPEEYKQHYVMKCYEHVQVNYMYCYTSKYVAAMNVYIISYIYDYIWLYNIIYDIICSVCVFYISCGGKCMFVWSSRKHVNPWPGVKMMWKWENIAAEWSRPPEISLLYKGSKLGGTSTLFNQVKPSNNSSWYRPAGSKRNAGTFWKLHAYPGQCFGPNRNRDPNKMATGQFLLLSRSAALVMHHIRQSRSETLTSATRFACSTRPQMPA